MFIMQNNESRLIKAAKRTIRAEATLVIIIIVISSWSMYALYKFTTGSDSFFGLTFARSGSSSSVRQDTKATLNLSEPTVQNLINNHIASLNYSQQDDSIKQKSQQLLQQLITGQRELYANLDSFRGPIISHPVEQVRRASLVPAHNRLDGNFKLISNYHHFPVQQNQRLPSPLGAGVHVANRQQPKSSVDTPTYEHYTPTTTIDRLAPPDEATEEAIDRKAEEDREAAESTRESGGSVIDGGSDSSDGDNQSPVDGNSSSSSSLEDSEGPHSSEQETSSDQEGSTSADNQAAAQTTTIQPESSDGSGSSSSDDDSEPSTDDDSSKETSQSIDDEVERMTQPSSGVVHQQERPFDYKNTVQFDDSLSSGYGIAASTGKAILPGSQVASFEAPQPVKSLAVKEQEDDDANGDDGEEARDLQVDHNSLVARSGSINDTHVDHDIMNKDNGSVKRRKKVITSNRKAALLVDRANDTKAHIAPLDQPSPDRANRRQKRDAPSKGQRMIIRAPYEIEEFLNQFDFDNLSGMSSTPKIVVRHSRALNGRATSSLPKTVKKLSPALDVVHSSELDEATKVRQNNTNTRSGVDEINYAASDDDIQFDNLKDVKRPNFTQIFAIANGSHPMPSYVTSNDSALQELLSKKQLLDALKYYQLPPPYSQNDSSFSSPLLDDTKTAGSLYHVDHGLMLVPSAAEKHSHKSKKSSMSKKKKKLKKKHEKKKSTVAFKKGGHKKKKHKKEEKKYLKEKKFKGAKKGKKVSKGKGGAGGKKGKKLYKDKGYKKKGFKKVYHKEEWGNKKSFFDEFRDKDFKKKWKKFDDKYNYAQMKKFQAKDEKGAKKMKHHDESHKKYDNGKWKKSYQKHSKEHKEMSKKNKKSGSGF